MKIINISDMETLIRELNDCPTHYIFRGHANSEWGLMSALERTIGAAWSGPQAKKFEDYSLKMFKSKYHIYNNGEHTPSSKLSWLSVMQHYGVPTRLLDFSESPYIALYFAIESYDAALEKDISIFAMDYRKIMKQSVEHIKTKNKKFDEDKLKTDGVQDSLFDDFVDKFSYDILWITEPHELNARIDRQSGTFLIAGNKERKIEFLMSQKIYKNCDIKKYVIQGNLYKNCYALLKKMSVNSKSIYGDLSGLAKYIRMDMQVRS